MVFLVLAFISKTIINIGISSLCADVCFDSLAEYLDVEWLGLKVNVTLVVSKTVVPFTPSPTYEFRLVQVLASA